MRWLRALIWVVALVVWCLLTSLWPTSAHCLGCGDRFLMPMCVCVCVCVTGRRTTTMSTQSVTALDPGGEWPSHTAPGPALDYQNLYAALSAVSISVTEWKLVCVCVCVCVCVYLTFLVVRYTHSGAWKSHHHNLFGFTPLKDQVKPQLLCCWIIFSIYWLVIWSIKMSENGGKCLSVIPKVQDDVLRCLVSSTNPKIHSHLRNWNQRVFKKLLK